MNYTTDKDVNRNEDGGEENQQRKKMTRYERQRYLRVEYERKEAEALQKRRRESSLTGESATNQQDSQDQNTNQPDEDRRKDNRRKNAARCSMSTIDLTNLRLSEKTRKRQSRASMTPTSRGFAQERDRTRKQNQRSNQIEHSPTSRQRIRESNRLQKRAQREDPKLLGEEEASRIDGNYGLKHISDEVKNEILNALRVDLGPSGLDESVCCVCDRLTLTRESKRVRKFDRDYLRVMESCLCFPEEHLSSHYELIKQYDCSGQNSRSEYELSLLKGLMLSRVGMEIDTTNETFILHVCRECDEHFQGQAKVSGEERLPPKFSIANHFFVGKLPDALFASTWPEFLMTQLVSVIAQTRVIRGGKHRSLRSHCLVFDGRPSDPVTRLPRNLKDEDIYRVILAGNLTEKQERKCEALHIARHGQVRKLLVFFKKNNPLYEDVEVPVEYLSDTTRDDFQQVPERIIIRQVDADEHDIESMELEQEDVTGRRDGTNLQEDKDEDELIERNVLFTPEHYIIDRKVLAARLSRLRIPQATITHSSTFAPDEKGLIYAKMHAHLFPYGRGHPAERRRVYVSPKDCIKYYISLSSRRFAQDKTFMLCAFDRLAMQNMYSQASFSISRHPNLYDSYEKISEEQLQNALLEQEKRARGEAPDPNVNARTDNQTAAKFLRTVQVNSANVWGSAAEREICRKEAFAYQTRFGRPGLFVTLSPNADNSFVMSHYAGQSSVQTIFDSCLERLPSKSKAKSDSKIDDVAAARLFTRTVDCFIKHVLGFDRKAQASYKMGGLFGHVKAYYGMVETQGRGALHIHFIIWIRGIPRNADDFKRAVGSSEDSAERFSNMVASYVDSVVTTDLPFPVEGTNCQNCNASGDKLTSLPVPIKARIDPNPSNAPDLRLLSLREPYLLQCGNCGSKCSVQHVVRNLLLQHRPTSWPPTLPPLTQDELRERIHLEAPHRTSTQEASYRLQEREELAQITCQFQQNSSFGHVYTDMLHYNNTKRNRYTRQDEDLMQRDVIRQYMERFPPSLDDCRLTEYQTKVLLLNLVVMHNMHWWAHTGSCFKKSKGIRGLKAVCRYNFPRPIVEETSFDNSAVQIKRRRGHEYINGYNPIIMLGFKCNHDIQVLIGGNDVTERIYYVCKYVAKPQNKTDCATALALAAFHRRVEREKLEQESSQNLLDPLQIARRRVNSMVYSMTNRQEVAGPLAAFYILNNKCSYQSHTTTRLKLQQAICQLNQQSDYQCSLVQVSEEPSNLHRSGSERRNHFKAASQLDDYIYRPSYFEKLCFYEFVMQTWRKQRVPTTSPTMMFKDGHPLVSTHAVGKHIKHSVPVISGPRLAQPDPNNNDSLESHGKIVLILFKPFRTLIDLIDTREDSTAWHSAYTRWKNETLGEQAKFADEILNNMYDYHSGRRKATQEKHDQDRDMTPEGFEYESDEDEDYNDHEMDALQRQAQRQNSSLNVSTGSDSYNYENEDEEPSISNTEVPDIASLRPELYARAKEIKDPKLLNILENFTKHRLLESIASQAASRYCRILQQRRNTSHTNINQSQTTMEQNEIMLARNGNDTEANCKLLEKWLKDTSTDNTVVDATPQHDNYFLEETTRRPMRIYWTIETYFTRQNLEWKQSRTDQGEVTTDTTHQLPIAEISANMTLNEKQHYAFVLIGTKIVKRWLQRWLPTTPDISSHAGSNRNESKQILMFLGGEGGTGKSRVIAAIKLLCKSWGQLASLKICAMTGKAATLIEGSTLDSMLKFLERQTSRNAIENFETLIIDEVSMLSKKKLIQLDKILRKAKNMDAPFGGVNIILAGDFLQLPPVGGKPIYTQPPSLADKGFSTDDVDAFSLWKLFTTVIVLTENMRFKDDPEWGEGCSQARFGIWTDKFKSMINNRHIFGGFNHLTTEQGMVRVYHQLREMLQHGDTKFVVMDNATRIAINNLFIKTTADALPTGHYPIRVKADFRGALQMYSTKDKVKILSSAETCFDKLAPFLDLVPGMPIQVTHNVRTTKGISNGTCGTLVDIRFPPQTQFKQVHDKALGIHVLVPTKKPLYALVQLERGEGAQPAPGFSDPSLVPLLFNQACTKEYQIQLSPAPDGQERSFNTKGVIQFPFVCAAAATVYKVQGETLRSLGIVEWQSKNNFVNKPQQAYLMVSRVVTRNCLLLLQEFSDFQEMTSVPPQESINEEIRLHQISDQTEIKCKRLIQNFNRF